MTTTVRSSGSWGRPHKHTIGELRLGHEHRDIGELDA